MTIALQREHSSDTIFFDAVLSYTQTYQSKLTSNPIDGSPSGMNGPYTVNDHIIVENPTFTIKGIFSAADFNVGRPSDSSYAILNDSPISDPVSVVSVGSTVIDTIVSNIIPLGRPQPPQVSMSERSSNVLQKVKAMLLDVRAKRETVTLIEFTNGKIAGTPFTNMVITNLSFPEDVESGDSLTVDMTLQQATFVDLVVTQVKKQSTSASLANKAAPTQYSGTLTKNVQTSALKDISSSLSNMIDSIVNPNGNALKVTMYSLQNNGLLPQ